MSRDTYLTADDAVLSDLGRTSDTALRSHYGIVTDDDIVRNLAEVVDLHAFSDDGRLHFGLVDGGSGADFDIVTDDDIAQVLDFLPGTVRLGCVSETVGSDDCIGMDDHVVTYYHSRIDAHARIDDAMGTYLGIVTDIYVFVDFRIVADYGMMAYV